MPNKLKQHAVNLLARRDHAKLELANKLKIKGYDHREIDNVLNELIQAGYLSESRFVENYIRWRCQKGYGPERIARELASRGITDTMIADLLDFTDNAWLNEALKVRKKHFKNQIVDDFTERVKQMRFLKYRGFTNEQIKYVFGGAEELNE